jgi:PAS domain-containing protein
VSTGSAAKESVRRRKDGSLVYVDVTTKLVRSADDASELIVISHRDVTATHCLHEDAPIQAPFGSLLESAPDAIVIVNALGRIVLVHVQTDQLVGHRSNDLVGKSVALLARAVPGRARLFIARAALASRRADLEWPAFNATGCGMTEKNVLSRSA